MTAVRHHRSKLFQLWVEEEGMFDSCSNVRVVIAFLLGIGVTSAFLHAARPALSSSRLFNSAASQFAAAQAAQRQAMREEEAQRRYHTHLDLLGEESDVLPGSISDPNKWSQYAGQMHNTLHVTTSRFQLSSHSHLRSCVQTYIQTHLYYTIYSKHSERNDNFCRRLRHE